jgi:hypothetical protein
MNRELARKIADAVLYEGYMLYPYRRSALKNRQRWSFGILYPPGYAEVQSGTERCSMHCECLLERGDQSSVHIELRFLHLASHRATRFDVAQSNELESPPPRSSSEESWDEGIERSLEFEFPLPSARREFQFTLRGTAETYPQQAAEKQDAVAGSTQRTVTGAVSALTEPIRPGVLKLSIDIKNTTSLDCDSSDRDSVLFRSLLSAHAILSSTGASFFSLLDPPQDLQEAAKACTNIGNFPVLLGEPGEREMLLCSPIILYDYPQTAPESAGDFYDATEMDEMLMLRILTLTEDEKNQAKSGDLHVRELMERTGERAREQLMRTHGAIRSLRPVQHKQNE